MARSNRFFSFLGRFEEQLEVDCERLKRQLVDRVDRQFSIMRTKVAELKNRFGYVPARTIRVCQLEDDPEVVSVSLEDWLNQKQTADEQQHNMSASTSSGRKRASQSQARSTTKKRKSNPSNINQTKKFACKFQGCQQSFMQDTHLVMHEHIHLGIKPYSCTWPNCRYSSEKRYNIVLHVRSQHFKLPASQKEQQRLNIIDDRNPNEYVQVDTQLVDRRLE